MIEDNDTVTVRQSGRQMPFFAMTERSPTAGAKHRVARPVNLVVHVVIVDIFLGHFSFPFQLYQFRETERASPTGALCHPA